MEEVGCSREESSSSQGPLNRRLSCPTHLYSTDFICMLCLLPVDLHTSACVSCLINISNFHTGVCILLLYWVISSQQILWSPSSCVSVVELVLVSLGSGGGGVPDSLFPSFFNHVYHMLCRRFWEPLCHSSLPHRLSGILGDQFNQFGWFCFSLNLLWSFLWVFSACF